MMVVVAASYSSPWGADIFVGTDTFAGTELSTDGCSCGAGSDGFFE